MSKRSLLMVVMMVLAMPVAALAHGHSYRRHGHGGYDRPQPRLACFAGQLEEATNRTYGVVRHDGYVMSFARARALDELRDLNRQTRRFRRRIRRYEYLHRGLEADFHELQRAYHRAMFALDRCRNVRPFVYEQIAVLEQSMGRLQRAVFIVIDRGYYARLYRPRRRAYARREYPLYRHDRRVYGP